METVLEESGESVSQPVFGELVPADGNGVKNALAALLITGALVTTIFILAKHAQAVDD